jgi:hypothetical protein
MLRGFQIVVAASLGLLILNTALADGSWILWEPFGSTPCVRRDH